MIPPRKNNMTLLACMYLAELVRPTLIPSREGKSEMKSVLHPTPVPMNKASLEEQAIKIRKAEDKRHARQIKRLAHTQK